MCSPAFNTARSPRLLVFALICGFLLLPQKSDAQFTFATDNASNAAYSGGLASSDNGGSGFNAWSISYGNLTSTFVGNPSSAGIGTTGIGTTAWVARADGNTSGWVDATRSLSTAMQVGDSLSFYWAMNWDSGGSGGSKGFNLKSGATNIFTLRNGANQTISYLDAGTGTVSGNYGTTPMLVTINRTSSSQYGLTITRRDTNEGTFSFTLNSALNLDGVNFFQGKQSDTSVNQNTYFNHLQNANSGNYNSSGNRTESRALTGTGNLTISNSTNLTLTNGGNTFNGTTTIQSGTLSMGNGGADGFIGSTSSITNNGSLIYNLTSSGTLGMVISGNGSLVKQSTGTLTLSGANTYTGVTTISAGTLALGASNAIADTSSVSVAAGSTLALGGNSNTIGRLTGAGAVSLGAGTLTSTYSGGGGFRTFSGVISGSGGFTLAGASDFNDFLTISGSNTYTGATTLTGATLILGADNSISSSSALVISGGRLSASNRNQTFHSLVMDSGAILRDGGTLTFSNGASFNGGSVTIRNNGGVISSSGATTLGNVTFTYNASTSGLDALVLGGNVVVTSGASALFEMGPAGGQGHMKLGDTNRVFDVGENATATVNWVIHSTTLASGALTKNGSGTLVMNAVNTYTGGTTVNAGTLVLGNASNTLANAGAVTVNGGTLSLGVNSDTIGALTLTGGSITGTTGVLTASSLTLQNGTVSAILAGSASINKTTSGTLTLAGNNTVSGGITLSAGQLNLNAAGALGSGNFTILGGTLGNTAGSAVTLSSTAAQFWNANFAFAGPDALNLGTGAVAINATRTITVDAGNLIVGGAISGTGFGLTKNGTGTLTLAGANTYSSATTVNAGTLALGASNVIANSSDVAVASGAVLELGGFNDTIGKLTGGGAVNLGSGTLTTTYGSGSGTFSGVLSGTGSFTLAGAADYNAFLTINGSNTYTGATNVLGATLILGANNVLSSSSTLNIAGGRFSASNRNQTFHSINMTSGVLERNGGTLAFNNASSFMGGNVNIGNDGGRIETNGTTTLGNVTFTYNASTANFNALVLGGGIAVGNGTNASMVLGSAGGSGFIKLGNANRVFDVGENANFTINWVVTSDTLSLGGLTKNGSGTLTLNVGNPYTGGTTLNAGTLVLGHATNTLADTGTLTINGGTLSLGSNSDTVAALTLTGGAIASTSGVLTASSYALQNGTVSAILGGSASINKTTAGTVTLSAANTFSGGITLGGGTLVLGNANAAGSGVINQTSGSSVLSIDTGGTISNTMSVSNVLARQSATLNGTITVNNATFDVENGDTLTISGGVGGGGGVVKNGGGTLVLSGSNTYAGATTVNAGTLNAANANALGTNASVTVHGGSLLVSADGALAAKNITLNSTTTAGLVFSGNYNGSIGKLTLAANSIIDLGVGNNVVARFAELEFLNDSILKIYHWNGTPLWEGGNGNNPDQIYFASGATGNLGRISFYSDFGNAFLGNGYQILSGDFANQVIPVPEPETWLAAALLASFGLVGLLRKKFRRS